jgi:hypothetical protein
MSLILGNKAWNIHSCHKSYKLKSWYVTEYMHQKTIILALLVKDFKDVTFNINARQKIKTCKNYSSKLK